jgi:hypothetical protein
MSPVELRHDDVVRDGLEHDLERHADLQLAWIRADDARGSDAFGFSTVATTYGSSKPG